MEPKGTRLDLWFSVTSTVRRLGTAPVLAQDSFSYPGVYLVKRALLSLGSQSSVLTGGIHTTLKLLKKVGEKWLEMCFVRDARPQATLVERGGGK